MTRRRSWLVIIYQLAAARLLVKKQKLSTGNPFFTISSILVNDWMHPHYMTELNRQIFFCRYCTHKQTILVPDIHRGHDISIHRAASLQNANITEIDHI